MNVPEHSGTIRRMLEARLKKLGAQKPVLGASLVEIAKHCGRSGCRCQKGEKHVGNYITYSEHGKTRTVYVPLDLVEDVRAWIHEHRRLKRLMKEISELSVALVRRHVTDRRRRAGRS